MPRLAPLSPKAELLGRRCAGGPNDWRQSPLFRCVFRLEDVFREAPPFLICGARGPFVGIAGLIDPVRLQFDAFKHRIRDSSVERQDLAQPRRLAVDPSDHDLARCGPARAEARARRERWKRPSQSGLRADVPRGSGNLATAVSAGTSCPGQLKTCP